MPLPLPGMFGGFEVVVLEESEYQILEEHYVVIAHFLGNLDLRSRMLQLTPGFSPLVAQIIKTWSIGHQFKWKWQYLIRFLAPLLVVLPPSIALFDPVLMSRADSSLSPLSTTLVREFRKALSVDILTGASHVLLMWARALTRETRFYAGCDCHDHLLADTSKSMRARLIAFNKATAECKYGGRRLLTMVCGHVDKMLHRLANTKCPKFEQYVGTCQAPLAARSIAFSNSLNGRLLTRLDLKLGFRNEAPYVFIGAIGYRTGHCSKSHSKSLVREGLRQRDEAIASGRASQLHKVTHRFVLDGDQVNPHRLAFEEFADDPDVDLDLPTVVLMRDYSLGKVTTRKTEAQHAHIKGNQQKKVSRWPNSFV